MDKITFNHLDDIRHYVYEIRSARTLNEARDYADHIMEHAEDLNRYYTRTTLIHHCCDFSKPILPHSRNILYFIEIILDMLNNI